MPNVRGKAYAMNVLTPMKRWKTGFLRLAFKVFAIRSTQKELRALAFIHFAKWTVISPGQFPRFAGMGPREGLKHDYLLFESNFNGSWNEYVDAFHSVLPFKLNLVWMWSENYPGSVPLSPFKAYIERNQYYTDYYYMAHPGSTANDVRNAFAVEAAFGALSAQSEGSDEAFAAAYRAFLGQVQNRLAATGGSGPRMS